MMTEDEALDAVIDLMNAAGLPAFSWYAIGHAIMAAGLAKLPPDERAHSMEYLGFHLDRALEGYAALHAKGNTNGKGNGGLSI